MLEYGTVDHYWTIAVEPGAVDPYWRHIVSVDLYCVHCGTVWHFRSILGRCGRVWHCRSLLETLWYSMALLICTGYVVVEYGSVDVYWGRCGRVWCYRPLLGMLR